MATAVGLAISIPRYGSTGTPAPPYTPPALPLLLRDFDQEGYSWDLLVLIEIAALDNFYADTDRSGTSVPVDGEIGLGPDNTLISRIRWETTNGRLIFNHNDKPGLAGTRGVFRY